MSSRKIEKINHKTYKRGNIILGERKEYEFDVKDKDGKPTGEKQKYWRGQINHKYGDNDYGSALTLEGPRMRARVYYNKFPSTYMDKETKKTVVGDDKYTILLSPLSGNKCANREECENYVEMTNQIREDLIKAFMGGYAKACGYSEDSGFKSPESFNQKTLKDICDYPKKKGEQTLDKSKGKQEYNVVYSGCNFELPKKLDPAKYKDNKLLKFTGTKLQRPSFNLDFVVDNGLELEIIPLIRYTTFHIGLSVLKIKKYLKSAVVLKFNSRVEDNDQEDTLGKYEDDDDVSTDIMNSFSSIILTGKKKEGGEGGEKEKEEKEKEVKKEVKKEKKVKRKKSPKKTPKVVTRSPDPSSSSSSSEEDDHEFDPESLAALGKTANK